MARDANQTYCGAHFAIYTYIESLCCTPETNIMFYVNCIALKKRCLTILLKIKKDRIMDSLLEGKGLWIVNLTLPLTDCSGCAVLNLFGPQFPHLQNGH